MNTHNLHSGWGKDETKYFYVFLGLFLANLLSLTVFTNNFPPLRYLRQPSLLLALAVLLHYFPRHSGSLAFPSLVQGFFFFSIYLFFNILTSIDPVNSAPYTAWLLFFFLFLYQFLVVRNQLAFTDLLRQFSRAGVLVGAFLIAISYLGGYVLGIEAFFDERFNYTLGQMTTEFAGVFGSNNYLGMLTFLTAVMALFLFELNAEKKLRWLFLGMSIGLSGLLFVIGNRASMACGALFWFLYTVWVYRTLLGGLLVLVSMVVGFTVFQDTLTQKLRLEQFEGGNLAGNRSTLIDEAMEVVSEMNFFGVGYQNQRLSRKYYRVVGRDDKEYNFHNTYLAVLAELGYLGLLWIPGVLIWALFRPARGRPSDLERRLFRMIRVLFLLFLLVYLPVEDTINSPGSISFFFFWALFFILLIGLENPSKPPLTPHENSLPFQSSP